MEKTLNRILTSALLENAYTLNLSRLTNIDKVNGNDGFYYIRFDYSDFTYDLFRFKVESIRNNFFKSYSDQFRILMKNNQSKNSYFH